MAGEFVMDFPTEPLSKEDHEEFLQKYWEMMTLSFINTTKPAVEGFYKKINETKINLDNKKMKHQQLVMAAAASVEKAAQAQDELEKKIEAEECNNHHEHDHEYLMKQRQTDDDKEKLKIFREKLALQKENFKAKKEKVKPIIQAWKAVNKMYSENLFMKLELDQTTRLITLIFQIPDSDKYVDYKITLRETEHDQYFVVNPPEDISIFSDELQKTNNIAKFLCQIREHAIALISPL